MSNENKFFFIVFCLLVAAIFSSGMFVLITEHEAKKEIAKIKAKTKELDSEYHYQRGKNDAYNECKGIIDSIIIYNQTTKH